MTLNGHQFEQLAMFASARELRQEYAPSDYRPDRDEGDPENMWSEKHDEAWADGLYDRIADEGVRKPVNVRHSAGGKELLNGHHRVAAQFDADPDALIPLNHTTNMFEGEPNPWRPWEMG